DHHVETTFQCQLRRLKMHKIGCHNSHKIHTPVFRQLLFLLNHFMERTVHPFRVQEKRYPGLLGPFRIDTEGTTNELYQSIHVSGDTMHSADKSVDPSANHSHSQLSFHIHSLVL